jgi:Tetracyclin repressor-like, C-terminal domain
VRPRAHDHAVAPPDTSIWLSSAASASRAAPGAEAGGSERISRAGAFPELRRRYFEEIVAPRRDVMHRLIQQGIASGEIQPDIDVAFVNEVLVGPILARMGSGATGASTPGKRAGASSTSSMTASGLAEPAPALGVRRTAALFGRSSECGTGTLAPWTRRVQTHRRFREPGGTRLRG